MKTHRITDIPLFFLKPRCYIGEGDQRHAQVALPPGNDPVPIVYEAGWAPGRSGRVRKISPHANIRSPDRPARSELQYRLSYRGPSN